MQLSSSPPTLAPQSRKRCIQKVDELSNLSSDPPIFSSDPPDAAIDCDRNRKRVYRGHWWSHRSPVVHKNELERNFDSGVFMASDDSLPSSDAHVKIIVHKPAYDSVSSARPAISDAPAQAIVNRALEHGDQIVDLSNLQLPVLSNEIPLALLSLVNPPRFQESAYSPDEQEYQSLVSHIQLFLANNALKQLPPAIWRLQNLTVLSLRNNRLTNIPGGIANLTNLQELNLSNNCLRWLPWELLQLLGPQKPLKRLHVRPNPLFSGLSTGNSLEKIEIPNNMAKYRNKVAELAKSIENDMIKGECATQKPAWWLHRLLQGILKTMETFGAEALRQQGPTCLWNKDGIDFTHHCFPVASSQISYLAKDGSLKGKQISAPSDLPESVIHLPGHEISSKKAPTHLPGAQSLLELAMKRCAVSFEAERRTLADLMYSEAPAGVMRAIDRTYAAMAEGSRSCTTCSRQFIIPRTEWIEYWHCIPTNASAISPDEMFWPFMRRGCSWTCVH